MVFQPGASSAGFPHNMVTSPVSTDRMTNTSSSESFNGTYLNAQPVVTSVPTGAGGGANSWTSYYNHYNDNSTSRANPQTLSQVALGGLQNLWKEVVSQGVATVSAETTSSITSSNGGISTTTTTSYPNSHLSNSTTSHHISATFSIDSISRNLSSLSLSRPHSQNINLSTSMTESADASMSSFSSSSGSSSVGGGGGGGNSIFLNWLNGTVTTRASTAATAATTFVQSESQSQRPFQRLFSDEPGDHESFFLYEQQQQDDPMSLPSLNMILNETLQSSENNNYTGFFGNGTDGGFGNGTDIGGDGSFNYWALIFIIFPVFTVFGNVLVIMSVKRERTLHNVTNYFIVSLAVADLLVAALVMPFAVYFLFLDMTWALPPIYCDFYIAMDVVCSTSSICNLVAISIDRFIAVTQPIKYAKHKSNTRVWLTIVFVWVFSGLVGSPIVLGLNSPPPDVEVEPGECSFHNKYFVLFSSLCSFYIPCAILVYLYYRIFKVIRERAKKAQAGSAGGGGGRKPPGNVKVATVIENLAQTKRLAETTLGGPSSLPIPPNKANTTVEDEKLTNTGSGSQEDGDDLEKEDIDVEVDGDDASPDSDDCHIIPNNQATSAFALESVKEEEKVIASRGNVEANGNHDSGYAASNMEDALAPGQEPSPASPKLSLVPPDLCKRNGLNTVSKEGTEPTVLLSPCEASTGSNKKPASRFTICKVHKASRKKREKSSAKRERKATKTLAIVLGLFLICWLPFFTCNIMDALCTILKKCYSPGIAVFLTTTWLGYVNSCLNPVIYTIFNPEFRKAFKKIMGFAA